MNRQSSPVMVKAATELIFTLFDMLDLTPAEGIATLALCTKLAGKIVSKPASGEPANKEVQELEKLHNLPSNS